MFKSVLRCGETGETSEERTRLTDARLWFEQQAMDETFLLSNIAPQIGDGFNRHCRFLTLTSHGTMDDAGWEG